jgi:excisionase family DNA binding protein
MSTGSTDQDRNAVRDRMARVRQYRRRMSPSEAATMAHRGSLRRALQRLTRVLWPPDPLSVAHAAFVLNVSRAAVCAAIKDGRLNAAREGGRYKLRRADVQTRRKEA